MSSLKTYTILSMLLLCASCEKDFFIDEQHTGKKMVVNCVFDNLRIFRVYVTESSSLTGSTSLNALSNAQVQLYEDGKLKEQLIYVPSDTAGIFGSYQSTFMPALGKKYSIIVTHDIYGTITAEDILPQNATVTSYDLTSTAGIPNGTTTIGKINFNDDGSQQNFYRLNIWMTWQVKRPSDSVLLDRAGGMRPEMLSEVPDSIRDNGWYLLFSDRTFNGQSKELNFYFYGIDTQYVEHATAYLELHTVSQTHYEYYRTLELYYNSQSFEAEPVSIYSNIKNGYGIFMADAINTIAVPLK